MKRTPVEPVSQTTEDRLSITKLYTNLAFITGLSYPTPKFFSKLSIPVRLFWEFYRRICEFSVIFMFISSVMLLILDGRNSIAVQTESSGAIAFVLYATMKINLLYRTKNRFSKIVKSVHIVAEEFANNPINSRDYLPAQKKDFVYTQVYSKTKTFILYFSVLGLAFSNLINGMISDDVADRHLPILGWYPFDFESRGNFATAVVLQLMYYPLLLGRDSAIDIIYMTILSVVSHQILYLGEILGKIIETSPGRPHDQQDKIVHWWLIQHKRLIKIIDDFQPIAQVWLFLNYVYTSFLFFLVLLRLTVESDFIVEQQVVIIAVNITNLLHLFVISKLGDDIAVNSDKIKVQLYRSELFTEKNTRQQYTALIVMTRCTRPLQLKFADNRVLAVTSFGDIMKSLLGYFTTVYQLRH